MYGKSSWKLTSPRVKQMANGSLQYETANCFPVFRKLKQGLWIHLEERAGAGDGREVQKGVDVCIPMA